MKAVYSIDGCGIFDTVYVYVETVSTSFVKSATPQSSRIETTHLLTVSVFTFEVSEIPSCKMEKFTSRPPLINADVVIK